MPLLSSLSIPWLVLADHQISWPGLCLLCLSSVWLSTCQGDLSRNSSWQGAPLGWSCVVFNRSWPVHVCQPVLCFVYVSVDPFLWNLVEWFHIVLCLATWLIQTRLCFFTMATKGFLVSHEGCSHASYKIVRPSVKFPILSKIKLKKETSKTEVL